MKKVYICDGIRTPIGSFNGALASVSAVDLGACVVKAILKRNTLSADAVDELIFGNVLQAGLGQNVARQVQLKAGISCEKTAMSLNMVCGSGLKSISLAAQAIQTNSASLIIAGGTESMSNAPHLLPKARAGYKMGNGILIDSLIADGLWDAFNDYHMGITAENLAEKYNISRKAQDQFAVASQEKAGRAIQAGRFKDEITPVSIPQRKGDPLIITKDEFPRPNVTIESLSQLRPAFKKEGTVTAGNASGINDGAAALILADEAAIKKYQLTPQLEIVSYASAGVDPEVMGIGPVPAVKKALQTANWQLKDIQLIEANEAFAVQSLALEKELGFDPSIVNVNGGAIALGHPIGASGSRIVVTLLHEMKRQNIQTGLATLCVGGGMGVALIVKKV